MKQVKLVMTFLAMGVAMPTLAESPDLRNMSPEERRAAIQSMSPEERESFKKARQEKWQGMSQSEKLELIEKRRTETIRKREQHWNNLSPEEKIRKAEEKMQKKKRGKPQSGQ